MVRLRELETKKNEKCIFLLFNYILVVKKFRLIVPFKSLRNSKRHNKGNKIKLCGGGGQHYLFFNKISTLLFNFLGFFTISKWIKQNFPRIRLKKIYFPRQSLKIFTFRVKLSDSIFFLLGHSLIVKLI